MQGLYQLSDEQREFRSVMRQFAEAEIAPHAADCDVNSEFPWASYEACRKMDLPGIGLPVEYGGTGADTVTQAIAIEELARVCTTTSGIVAISKLGMMPLVHFGSEEQRQKYIPRVTNGGAQASYCLSEADAGSDVAAIRCSAVRDGDSYVLNGSKYWITNAGVSDTYTIFAKTNLDAGRRGISCFLVEAEWGVRVAKHESKMGLRGSPTAEIILEDVRVPAENLVGKEGAGFTIAMHSLDRNRPIIGAQAVGIAQGAIDCAADYMKKRKAFGAPISDLQGLRFMLADMAIKTEAARALVYQSCSMVDHDPEGRLSEIGAAAKCFATDTAMSVTTDAVQLLGGHGYTTEYPVERFMRDAKITQIYEGTNQIQRVVVAKKILG
jgi:alkylation response protein AidB-like acyl-CoA dehydrogenase